MKCSTISKMLYIEGLIKSISCVEDLSDSVVATRLNGYVGGWGSMARFNRESRDLGLNSRMTEYIRSVIIKKF